MTRESLSLIFIILSIRLDHERSIAINAGRAVRLESQSV